MSASTRSSNRSIAGRTAPTVPEAAPRPSAGGDQLGGARRVAAPRRAVGLEGAPLAQRRRPGPEVVGGAGPLDRLPDGAGPLLETADRLLGGTGHDGDGLAQVEQLDAGRAPAEQLLAQERVEVDAPEARLLVPDTGCPPRLVVGDDELAVAVELEAV